MQPAGLIDLERYPVTNLDGPGGAVADHHAAELRDNGVSILPGFLRADARPALVAECDTLAEGAFHQDVQGTPYLESPDADLWPEGHPRVTWSRSSVWAVAYDRFDPATSGVIPAEEVGDRVLIAAVWVDPAAVDADLVHANDREAVATALAMGSAGPAPLDAVVGARDAAWNPLFPSRP